VSTSTEFNYDNECFLFFSVENAEEMDLHET
jgi:hypothetical protein